MKNLGIFGAIALLTCCIQNANAAPVTDQQFKLTTTLKWYMPYFDVGGYYSKLEPNEAGQANFFLPLLQNPNNLLFSSIRAYDKSGNPWEGNLSVGYRNLSANQNNLWGIYGSYDRLRSQAENYFNQATVGGEFWHQTWFAGANVYIPFGDTRKDDIDAQKTKFTQAAYQNTDYKNVSNIYYGAGYERAMTGFDAEIGNNIWRGLTVYAGGYYFDAHNVKAIGGPRARATYTWYSDKHRILYLFDRVRVETEAQYDNPRGFDWYAGLRFTVNLFHKPDGLQGVAKHMVDPINRDLDVVTQSYHNPLQLLKNKDGSAVNVADVGDKDGFEKALTDNDIDVVAVDGTIDSLSDEDISKDKYITGGRYSFNRDGQDFTVGVSNGGTLAGVDLQVNGANNVVIRDLHLQANTDGNEVISNNINKSFGTLTIDNISTNGRLLVGLTGGDKTGNVSVMNSYFNTNSWLGGGAAVKFIADNGAHLTVENFTNNTIITKNVNQYGVENDSFNNSTLTFNGAFSNNNIYTQGNIAEGVDNNAGGNSMLTFNVPFSGNYISTQGTNAEGVYNTVGDSSTLTFNGAFSNNNIYTQGNNAEGVYNYAFNNSALEFNGNFSDNHISTRGDYADGVYNLADNSTITFNGLFGNYVTSAKADDFYFQTVGSGQIDVYVNDPSGRGLSAANHGASINDYISPHYNVNIYPGP